MNQPLTSRKKNLEKILRKLIDASIEKYYNPYEEFVWPDRLDENSLWMSEDLLSIHGTPYMDTLNERQIWKLSKWESINFFSFNVHGIRELILHVLSRIHNAGFEETSEYFHHFIGEENEHMWFFAQFCKRYGGKIYFTRRLQFPSFEEGDIQNFISFAKILISEQIGDFYNVHMKDDEQLHPIVRKINRIHHEDESRHISMGLRVVKTLYQEIAEKYSKDVLKSIEEYLRKYIQFFLHSFYNPNVYKDAGLPEPYELRRNLIDHPARKEFHRKVLKNTRHFFRTNNIIKEEII